MLPQTGESLLNKVFYPLPEFTPSQEVIDFHNSLTIVDWHADSLMWTYRDLTQRSSVGHVDLPRLQEGNIAIQGMGSVTKASDLYISAHSFFMIIVFLLLLLFLIFC